VRKVLETASQFRSIDADRLTNLAVARLQSEPSATEAQRVQTAKARIARGVGILADFKLVQADVERQLDDDLDASA
jgi:hypothetical protein